MTQRESTELEDLVEHLERYRSVTLQVLDLVSDEQLSWRPGTQHYSLGQQLIHIAQAEDFHARGLFENDWNTERVRLPKTVNSRREVRDLFARVREYTLVQLRTVTAEQLGSFPPVPNMPVPWSLRSGLWFILEHELHHRGQIWLYLRQMGITPPFYAFPLPPGERPDIAARQALGGF
jgi:uncharacterized damage-inducible protein DinB